jgi:regulator of protease activity HflC (stomatin/prohibitin superfamily)
MSMASPLDTRLRSTDPTPEERVLNELREQIKEIEDKRAADVRKRQLQEEAESIRRQLRSWGVTPVA